LTIKIATLIERAKGGEPNHRKAELVGGGSDDLVQTSHDPLKIQLRREAGEAAA
jgi:hypothetical protein